MLIRKARTRFTYVTSKTTPSQILKWLRLIDQNHLNAHKTQNSCRAVLTCSFDCAQGKLLRLRSHLRKATEGKQGRLLRPIRPIRLRSGQATLRAGCAPIFATLLRRRLCRNQLRRASRAGSFDCPFGCAQGKLWSVARIFSSIFDILCSLFDYNQSQEKCLYVKRVRALRIAVYEYKKMIAYLYT